MTLAEVFAYAADRYGSTPQYLWQASPDSGVLRHGTDGKWYAVFTPRPAHTLGLPGDARLDLLSVKAAPALIEMLRGSDGYHPAYHMNRKHWISLRLDGSVPRDQVLALLDGSFDLTG
ncbi:MmcQ/YjbR family DNA-binding protein [Novispirillum itersonii]|uniref:Putative DNA-binding protein (MmcQ/YjbR family) n=1 Tax=Novispirillum itersonii TaxID=189 RepID=A0A7W9ZF11_NOVIT|nr:MmcQ/YjbR family DNA-binding protein [Novispirillum itersonii]MBB6210276.1 putative DNA-binding protein (MmcQ/YjbR family) [Novispirillum itersonii]